MKTPQDQVGERDKSRLIISTSKIRIYLAHYWQEADLRLHNNGALVRTLLKEAQRLVAQRLGQAGKLEQTRHFLLEKSRPLFLKFKLWRQTLAKFSPFYLLPCPVTAPDTGEDRVLTIMGASSVCPRCGGGPLLFEKAALERATNICPICTRTMQAEDYRPKLLECAYIVMEELCEKCGLPRYAESKVDWVKVSLICDCDTSSVKINSTKLREELRNALIKLEIPLPENIPPRGTKKIVCPFSGRWHKDPAVLYYKTGRMVCWNCRKMVSLLNLSDPVSPEAQAIAWQLKKVSLSFWEQTRPEKEPVRKMVTAIAAPPITEAPRPTRRELIDQWFSEKGHIPQKLAVRYQQWLPLDNRLALPVRPIPNWPPLVHTATLQRATHLERPGTTVHFVKGAVVTEDYTRTKQLIAHQESFWEDDSRHIVAELKVMDRVAACWEQQVYSFIERNDHLLDQWSRTQGRIFCAYVQTEAIPGITDWAWGTGVKTPDFVLLSVSNNNKLLVSICDIKLSARAWSAEHDQQLSPENFKELLQRYPLLIDHLLEAAYFAAPRLQQAGLKVEWPGDQAEFLEWLNQDRIQIQVGFRVIPDLPSRRRALLVTREKALHLNGNGYNGNGRYDEPGPIPDRPYLLIPCDLAALYQPEPGARLAEELVNFDGLGRVRGQIGTWERLWLYEKYSRRGLALAYLLRRKGWDTSSQTRLRYSLYECSAQLGVASSSQYLAQLLAYNPLRSMVHHHP